MRHTLSFSSFLLNRSSDFNFFFSSRRRHTRYWRDWSSDVCSSDLNGAGAGPEDGAALLCEFQDGFAQAFFLQELQLCRAFRSEERRVGKEWSTRWVRCCSTNNR